MSNQNQVPDRFGKCPCCGQSWDGGEIILALSKIDVFTRGVATSNAVSDKAVKVADMFGWTPKNQKRFSTTIGIEIQPNYDPKVSAVMIKGLNTVFFQCPNVMCFKVFDAITGEVHQSLHAVKTKMLAEEEA